MDSDLGEISCVSKMRLDSSEYDSQSISVWNPLSSSMGFIITGEHALFRLLAYRGSSTKNPSAPPFRHGSSLSCRFLKTGMEKSYEEPPRCFFTRCIIDFFAGSSLEMFGRYTKRAMLRLLYMITARHCLT